MKLYAIIVNYQGKDLDAKEISYYTLAEDDEEVYEHLSAHQFEEYSGGWEDFYGGGKEVKERIMKNKGDFNEAYMGEFYDIKWGWEGKGEISQEQVEVLKKFGILG